MRQHPPAARHAIALFFGIAVAFLVLVALPFANAVIIAGFHYRPSQQVETPIFQQTEVMPAFLGGRVVQTEYEQGYFTGTPNGTNASFGTEPLLGPPEVGTPPTIFPVSNKANIEPFWVLVPWFGPSNKPFEPAFNPAKFGIQLNCAPANIAICWDHPATIVVPGLGKVPLPGHDHLISTEAKFHDTWWAVIVVLVLQKSAFPTIDGSKGISSVSALREAQENGLASKDLVTNVFLNFKVLPNHGAVFWTADESSALQMQESMPIFWEGKVLNTIYEQGMFTGPVKFNSSFPGETLLAFPTAGITSGGIRPTPLNNTDTFWVLVPWFGPPSAPFEPAFDPAKFGIQLMCAPASVSVCFDHPPTIFVPGLGTVPLPGHDHLVSSIDQGGVDIYWHVVVVLVTDKAVWPSLTGAHGINSLGSLREAQENGQASADISTNVWIDFAVNNADPTD
jgi:hypothetical protein